LSVMKGFRFSGIHDQFRRSAFGFFTMTDVCALICSFG
jgi:hypothetical protein